MTLAIDGDESSVPHLQTRITQVWKFKRVERPAVSVWGSLHMLPPFLWLMLPAELSRPQVHFAIHMTPNMTPGPMEKLPELN